MLKLIFAFVIVVASGCALPQKLTYKHFEYSDFGPQAMAHELIGMNWWQWLEPGGFELNDTFNIQVVVYCDGQRSAIEKQLPVDKATQKDYRYITKNDAIDYLNVHISEDLLDGVTKQLKATKRTIESTITCEQ